jgi:hypothetical protein
MGLSICYELLVPAGETEATVREYIAALRAHAVKLPFGGVSPVVQLTERHLSGPWPVHGLAFRRLEDVVNVTARFAREDLYRRQLGMAGDDYSSVQVPDDLATRAIGFSVAPGAGSEPAAFGLVTVRADRGVNTWHWHCCCKTQYASVHGDDHLIRCHGSMVALLDAAREIGLGVVVHDETGYWESRDERELLARVTDMNRIVARFAGSFTDHIRTSGGDSRRVQGEIFAHPDFERLESEE